MWLLDSQAQVLYEGFWYQLNNILALKALLLDIVDAPVLISVAASQVLMRLQ